VMVSGNPAYERLVWQLGFTVVEVYAWLQLAIHMHATSLLQTRHAQEAAADAEAVQKPISSLEHRQSSSVAGEDVGG
jgi:hypothetical protein